MARPRCINSVRRVVIGQLRRALCDEPFTLELSGRPDAQPRRPPRAPRRASGVARVSSDGKSVECRSVAEIDRALEALEREIAAAEGRSLVRQVRIVTTKGL